MATKKHSMKKTKTMKKAKSVKKMSSSDVVGQMAWCLQCKKHVKIVSGKMVSMKSTKRANGMRIAGLDEKGHKVSKIVQG
jgi:hypothetical protein